MKDLRTPSGWFFLLLGLVLVIVSFTSTNTTAPLTTVNVNLYSGIAMLVFGGILLLLARLYAVRSPH